MKYCLLFTGLFCLAFCQAKQALDKPNIILIVADDLGYNDVGYHNPDVITPNIDSLAKEGVTFEKSYVQPACTPSRSALMTGMYPFHIGRQGTPPLLPLDPTGLTLDRTLLPQGLKTAGYSTHHVGKWHLGYCKQEYLPNQRGFDSSFGYWGDQVNYYTKQQPEVLAYDFHQDNELFIDKETYSMYLYQERTTEILRSHEKDRPLFLYMAMQNVHTPLQVPKKYEDMYQNVEDESRRIYLGMVTAMDDFIGNITKELQDSNLYENSIILFISDNGGNEKFGGASNDPLRGQKGQVYEGGVRTPSFIHSPLLSRSQYVSEEPIHITDWYPTLLKVANADDFEELTEDIDGLDQTDVIFGAEFIKSPRLLTINEMTDRTINSDKRSGAIQKHDSESRDNWKLVVNGESEAGEEEIKELFNLADDPNETINLAEEYPDVLDEMFAEFEAIYATMVPRDDPSDVDEDVIMDDQGNMITGWC